MPPCRPRRRKFWKFEEGYSWRRVMINNNNNNNHHQLDQPVITRITSPHTPIQKTALFCMFALFNFHPFSSGGQLTPICPYVRTPMPCSARWYSRQASKRICPKLSRQARISDFAPRPRATPRDSLSAYTSYTQGDSDVISIHIYGGRFSPPSCG